MGGPDVTARYGLLTKLVWSRWLDIGQVLFCVFMDRDEDLLEDLLYGIYYMAKDLLYGIKHQNMINFIFFLACERAEFSKSCNLIGSGSGRKFSILPAHGAIPPG